MNTIRTAGPLPIMGARSFAIAASTAGYERYPTKGAGSS
jgi:hypothetical protein